MHNTSPTTTKPNKALFGRAISPCLWLLKDQWFLVGLVAVIVISSQVQVPSAQQQLKSTIISYLSPATIFFITGCTLSTRTLIDNYSQWKLHVFVQGHCFLVTSALGFAVVSAVASKTDFMDPWLLLGLVINACLPTTIASNVVMTRQANGNVALTVVQTTIGSFLGVILSPALVKMYVSCGAWYTHVLPQDSGGLGAVFRRSFMQLGLTVYVPLVLGQVVQNLFPTQARKLFIEWHVNKVGSLALLILIWQIFDRAFQTKAFESVPKSNIVFVGFISVANWLLWLVVSASTAIPWMDRRNVASVCCCVPAKTLAVGVPLSSLLWVDLSLKDVAKLQIPIVLFQAFQLFLGSLLTIPLRKWIANSAKDASLPLQAPLPDQGCENSGRLDGTAQDDQGCTAYAK